MGGVFTNKTATELSVVAANAAMQSAGIKPEKIDSVIFGQVLTVRIYNIIYIIKENLNNTVCL